VVAHRIAAGVAKTLPDPPELVAGRPTAISYRSSGYRADRGGSPTASSSPSTAKHRPSAGSRVQELRELLEPAQS
jgi:hypothetical protein